MHMYCLDAATAATGVDPLPPFIPELTLDDIAGAPVSIEGKMLVAGHHVRDEVGFKP
jgi:hypothetical protein